MALESKQYQVVLTGGTTYDTVTLSTIKYYEAIQIVNDTGADMYIKYNDDTVAKKYEASDIFFNESHKANEPLRDVVKVNGTGTITVELRSFGYP